MHSIYTIIVCCNQVKVNEPCTQAQPDSDYRIEGHFRWVLFSLATFVTESPNMRKMLRAYNENKTTKIRFQGLITKFLSNENF